MFDGKQVGSQASANLDAQALNFVVGKTTGDAAFTGWLSDVLIDNAALTPAQVALLYNAGVNGGNLLPVATPLTIAANATLDLAGASQQVASLSDAIPGSGGSVINSNTALASVLSFSPAGGSTTFSGQIVGGGGNGVVSLVMSGNGAEILAGSNSYSGGTTVAGGMLQLANQSAVPDNTPLTILGGTLDLGGFTKTTTAAVSFQGGVAQNGVIVNHGEAYDGQAGTVAVSLQGAVGMNKTTGGVLSLNNANTFSGPTTISGGALSLGNPLALQNSSVSLAANTTVTFAAGNTAPIFGGLAVSGSPTSVGGNINLATASGQPVTLSVGENGQSTLYNGFLSGPGGLTKIGAGMLTLSVAQTYGGPTVVSGGTLQLLPAAVLPPGTAAYYAFNNPNNLGLDSSGNGNNLNNNGAARLFRKRGVQRRRLVFRWQLDPRPRRQLPHARSHRQQLLHHRRLGEDGQRQQPQRQRRVRRLGH